MTFSTKVSAAFGAALIILLAVGVLSYQRIVKENEDQQYVTHTRAMLERLNLLQESLWEAETDQRDFIIGGERTFLDSYQKAIRRVRRQEAGLHDLVGDNSSQNELWSQLTLQIDQHITELQTAVDIRSGGDAAVTSVTPPDKQRRDKIRQLLTDATATERQLLNQRADQAKASARKVQIAIVTGDILAFVFLFAAALVIHHEMAKRRSAEQVLRESEERSRLMVSEVKDYAILMLDPKGYVASWNAGAERIKGYRPEEILGRHFSAFFPPEDVKAGSPANELRIAASRGRFEEEGWRVRKDGSRFWASVVVTALHDERNRLRGFAKVTCDITERKKAEEALKHSESRLTLALESAQMGVWEIDLKSGKIARSLRNDQIFGYDSLQSDWTQNILLSHVIPEDKEMVKAKFGEATFTGHFRIECRILWPNRSVHWIALRGRTHRNEHGGPTHMMGVVVDITELKTAQDDLVLRTAELETANKELEAFCYSVSHDLRAPLRAIDGFSQAVLEECRDRLDDLGKDYLNRVILAARRMNALIDDLLHLSRVTRAEIVRQEMDLTEVAQSIASDLQGTDPKRKVEFVIAPNLKAEGDPQLLRTVLENLMGNSWKFTSKQGYAAIEVGRIAIDDVWAFFVRDNGVGFDQKYVKGIFGAFQRLHATEFPGTGIGLASAHRIIQRHGGRIWAEAAIGRGATFYFTLLGPQKVAEKENPGSLKPEPEGIEHGEANYLVGRR